MRSREQQCSVYELAGDPLVLSESRTKDGVWIFNGRVERLSGDATAADLGAAVARALAASQRGVPHPSDWSVFSQEAKTRLNRVGVSSLSRLDRAARLVRVSCTAGIVTVVPHESGGASGPDRGFHELEELEESFGAGSDEILGGRIQAALERCR